MHLDLIVLFIYTAGQKVVKSHKYRILKVIHNLILAKTKATCTAKPKISLSQTWLPPIFEQYWQI